MGKAEKAAAPVAPVNPDNLPLTCGQAKELAAEFYRTLEAVYQQTSFNEQQWKDVRGRATAIITREPPAAPPPPPVRADGAGTYYERKAELVDDLGVAGASAALDVLGANRDALKGR
jgi:hypothetical protein